MSKKTATAPRCLSASTPSCVAMLVGILIATLWSSSPHAQSASPTVLITGSSQGHGLAFVQDYAERGWRVIATCRTPGKADHLQAIARQFDNVTIEELDLTDFPEVDALAEKYTGTPIDVLNLNGAINTFRLGPTQFGMMDYDRFAQVLQVNMIGQLYVAEAFLEHVAASKQKKIAVMSAVGGSIGRVNSTTAPAYRASKAGLNMLMRTYGEAVKERGVIVAIIAPGTVDIGNYLNAQPGTVMTERYRRLIAAGALAPRSAIGAMIDLIDGLTIDDIETFHRWDGQTLPW
jgi:NAD(P)-dependent dehydrogenase (short-subunit alcohol dehydrogenase family)